MIEYLKEIWNRYEEQSQKFINSVHENQKQFINIDNMSINDVNNHSQKIDNFLNIYKKRNQDVLNRLRDIDKEITNIKENYSKINVKFTEDDIKKLINKYDFNIETDLFGESLMINELLCDDDIRNIKFNL